MRPGGARGPTGVVRAALGLDHVLRLLWFLVSGVSSRAGGRGPEGLARRAGTSPEPDTARLNLAGAALPLAAGRAGVSVRLRPLPLDEALALLDGLGAPPAGLRWDRDYPLDMTLDALSLITGSHQAAGWSGGSAPGWWLHQIVLDGELAAADGGPGPLVVGDVGFHGPPPGSGPVEVEIGYDVVPSWRGRGVAGRACALVLEQAWRDGAILVRAETDPGNVASRRVLRGNGFTADGDDQYHVARPAGRGPR